MPRATIPILPGALRELLRRRDELLAADERAAVEAALASATAEERVEIGRNLARLGLTLDPGSVVIEPQDQPHQRPLRLAAPLRWVSRLGGSAVAVEAVMGGVALSGGLWAPSAISSWRLRMRASVSFR